MELYSGRPLWLWKNCFYRKILKNLNDMSDTPFNRIILYYGEWQAGYKELGKNVESREGLPQSSDYEPSL